MQKVPKYLVTFWAILKYFTIKKAVTTFWATFGDISSTFYSNIWSHWSYASKKCDKKLRNLKKSLAIIEGLFGFWQNIEPTSAHLECSWANEVSQKASLKI